MRRHILHFQYLSAMTTFSNKLMKFKINL